MCQILLVEDINPYDILKDISISSINSIVTRIAKLGKWNTKNEDISRLCARMEKAAHPGLLILQQSRYLDFVVNRISLPLLAVMQMLVRQA